MPVTCLRIASLALLAGAVASPAPAAPSPEGAAAIFAQAKAISDRDGGRFWGVRLYGPMLIVDPADRRVIANQPDPDGVLKQEGDFFVGTLPPEQVVANAPIEWSGKRWTELMWPFYEEPAKRSATLAHEMLHRVQPQLGLMRPEGDNGHLDTLDGRYLLQLEWRALAAALRAKDPAARRTAITDALLFRHERYRLFPQAAAAEAALETDEGVPEYTGVRLGLDDAQERIDYAVRDLSAFVNAPTFVRSFAYATGPAYGLLLDGADPSWRSRLASGQRFDQMLGAALGISQQADAAAVAARASAYDDGSLHTSEQAREAARQARMKALKAKLVDGPVLRLPLSHVTYQFNPQTLLPLYDQGTVYPSIRLTSDWGVLEVDDDALLDRQMKGARVSAVGIAPSHLEGKGWKLTLKPGWVVVPGERPGDFLVAPAAAGT